jgi:hypothetical protein
MKAKIETKQEFTTKLTFVTFYWTVFYDGFKNFLRAVNESIDYIVAVMGSVRVFSKPSRPEPKKSSTESNRTERVFKNLKSNRIESKKFWIEPSRTDFI